ncbi:MAG: hypothetical protein QM607_07115 [Microbacterium sp.]
MTLLAESPVIAPASTPTSQVAIIVPVEHGGLLLERALHSVALQTTRSWRLVLVAPPELTYDAWAAIATLPWDCRSRMRVVPTDGRPAAVSGAAATDAPYIATHHECDTWHPEFLQRAIGHLAIHPEQPGVHARSEEVTERLRGERFVPVSRTAPQHAAQECGIGRVLRRENLHEHHGDLADLGAIAYTYHHRQAPPKRGLFHRA